MSISNIDSKSPPINNTQNINEKPNQDLKVDGKEHDSSPNTKIPPPFRERKRGVWTLYFPLSTKTRTPLAMLGIWESMLDIEPILYVWWRFFSEVFSLGPIVVSAYFASLAISSILPSIKLKNDSNLLNLAEMALAGQIQHTIIITKFKQIFIEYVVTLVVVWLTNTLKEYSSSIVEQRVNLHFEQKILAVQSRLELSASQDPSIETGLRSVKRYSSRALTTLSDLLNMLSAVAGVIALLPILKMELVSSGGLNFFSLWPMLYPFLWVSRGLINWKDKIGYAQVTDRNWLRMKALYQIGTEDKYKQEVLSSGLEGYINSEYAESMSKLGDLSIRNPWFPERRLFSLENLSQPFDSLLLLFYAWAAVHNPSGFSLSAMVKIQQTNNAIQSAVRALVGRTKNISNLSNNITTLYEVLFFEPGIVDGDVSYPDESHMGQKGMSIEFKNVSFAYPLASNNVLENLSFKVEPGQLCVIVGENGCGKSTTINLINRLYDCDSGEIYIDGRPIRDYKISTLRATINIMYQSCAHFPLTIKENLLMDTKVMSSEARLKALEDAAKLGGAYEFIKKLPHEFETNLEPIRTGGSSFESRVADREQFKCLAAREKPTELSGGQWQRLANSENTRLLCYDEPSASLDPKAEVAIFERLRSLRGGKTMIFVTHRFGYLTKHADLIIYVGSGSVTEQGTHNSLLAKGGEYAKMYNIQSEAFADQ